MLKHLLLEVICFHKFHDSEKYSQVPEYCKNGSKCPGLHCLQSNCTMVGYTDAPLELSFSDSNGEVDIPDESASIGFGGDMEPEGISEEQRHKLKQLWEEICQKKITEAYESYLLEMKKILY